MQIAEHRMKWYQIVKFFKLILNHVTFIPTLLKVPPQLFWLKCTFLLKMYTQVYNLISGNILPGLKIVDELMPLSIVDIWRSMQITSPDPECSR